MRLAGICVAMAGIVWYSVLKLSEATSAARQLLPSTANGSHSPVTLASIFTALVTSVLDIIDTTVFINCRRHSAYSACPDLASGAGVEPHHKTFVAGITQGP
jgi:hypothetical protein